MTAASRSRLAVVLMFVSIVGCEQTPIPTEAGPRSDGVLHSEDDPSFDDATTSVVVQQALHEPPGMTLIASTDGAVRDGPTTNFSNAAFGWKFMRPWEQVTGSINVVNDPTNPTGSGKSLRFRWAAGNPGGAGKAESVATGFPNAPYREIYVRFRLFFEPGGWQHGHKFFYLRYGGTTTDRPLAEWPARIRLAGGLNSMDSSQGGTGVRPLVRNQWLTCEFHFRHESSPGANDGFGRIWVNGVLVAERSTGLSFAQVVSEDGGFDYFRWYAHANSVPIESYYRLGELYISGKRS